MDKRESGTNYRDILNYRAIIFYDALSRVNMKSNMFQFISSDQLEKRKGYKKKCCDADDGQWQTTGKVDQRETNRN